jgi:dTDP-glucose pyrophosphorylase
VVHYRKEDIIRYVPTLRTTYDIVAIERLRGIADGLHQVRHLADGPFIVVLGDCLCRGTFDAPFADRMGVGVIETASEEAIRRSYSVELHPADASRVRRVVEKPKTLINRLCGMGYYFLDPRVFPYIEATPPSPLRNEVEITDVIQRMIEGGEYVRAYRFRGDYVNITYPDDVRLAEAFLR